MRYRFSMLFLFAFLVVSCSAQTSEFPAATENLLDTLKTYEKLPSENQVKMNKKEEEGDVLLILGVLVSKETNKPIPNHKFLLYQAGIDGNYNESEKGDEKTARIRGEVTTNKDGRFFVKTIVPGDYGATAGNRHIHMFVPDTKPRGYDFYFGDFMGTGLRTWAEGSDQATILTLSKRKTGDFITEARLVVKGFDKGKSDKSQ